MKAFISALLLTAALHSAAQSNKPPEFRLGDAVTPLSYDLTLAIDPRQERFEGEVRIELRFERAAPKVWMNAQALEILEAHFTQKGRRLPARATTAAPYFVAFEVEGGFEAGDAVAEIRYKGALENLGTRGLFRQPDRGEWYVVSQFEALSARRALPCFDEPHWKTPWKLTLDAPAADGAFTNTPEESRAPAPGREGWTRHVFARTRPLPSYLVALAVGPFDVVDGGKAGSRGAPLRYIVLKGTAAQTRWVRKATPAIVAELEKYFGRPYPYEKLDSLTIPAAVGFGAMENVGLITYSSGLMLREPARESLAFKRAYASVGAHEIAHQWFGDLVTMAWWNDVWLNEGFATWMARKTLRTWRPEWESGWRSARNRREALAADRFMSARRVANPVESRNDMSGAFDAITYQKGAEVLAMFETWMGEERFREGVRRYIDAHADGNATSDDFLQAIGAASGKAEVTVAAFRSFIDQSGAPLIETRLRCDGGPPRLELAQHRFIPRGTSGEARNWITPACFHYAANGRMHKACADVRGTQELALEAKTCPDWVIGNADGAGHWLARLDEATLRRLVPHIPKLPESDAAALGVDTSLLLRSGLLDAGPALRIAEKLLQHPSRGARQSAVVMLDELRPGMLSRGDEGAVRSLELRFILPLARQVGWAPAANESLAAQDLREFLLPYAADTPQGVELRSQARTLAKQWLQRPALVDASIVPIVLRTAARHADEPLVAQMIAAIPRAANQRDRSELVEALSAVRAPKLRQRVFEALLAGEPFDGRDALNFIRKGLADKATVEPLFDFLLSHWDEVRRKLPPDSEATLMRGMAFLCTPGARDRFVAFFEPRAKDIIGGPNALRQSREAIGVCVASLKS